MSFISFSFILFFTLISWNFPTFSFLFMCIFSGVILILTFPYNLYSNFLETQKHLVGRVLTTLHNLDILDFIATLHIIFFCQPKRKYYTSLLIVFGIQLSYTLVSRYYFISQMTDTLSSITRLLIYICLFIGIACTYFRLLLHVSLIIIPLTLNTNRSLLAPSVIYILTGEESSTDSSDSTNKPHSLSSDKRYSFINVNHTRAYYRQYFSAEGPRVFRNVSLCIGICTMFAAGWAAYYAKEQADHARVQAEQAKAQTRLSEQQLEQAKAQTEQAKAQAEYARRQADQAERQADIKAVDTDLMTREEYHKKYKLSKFDDEKQ